MLRLAVLACVIATAISAHAPFAVVFQWNSIQFNWPSDSARQDAILHKNYIDVNNAIAGIKIWKDKMYLTIPRWKPGVPATLAVTSATPLVDSVTGRNITDPPLDAYPNWDMQALDNCTAFQFVQSMEIDPLGRMWVLDTGRTETMTVIPKSKCPPRLVILDLENNGTVLRNFVFPSQIAAPDSTYLNDIVLDHEDGGTAFITDNGKEPGIIVYSLKMNKARKVTHESMRAQADAVTFKVAGTTIISPIHIDGIALSPPGPDRLVYYAPLSSLHLYSVPVSVLKNDSVRDIQDYVKDLGQKNSQTDGMIMSNTGVLYYGQLADDAIAMWETQKFPSFASGRRTISRDHERIHWPDTFAFDEAGRLWCVANGLQNYINNHVDISRPNYRVLRSDTAMKNYQYFANGTAPELPVIEVTALGAANRIDLALSSCLTMLLVFLAR